MALLLDPQRVAVWTQWMHDNLETCAASKAEVRTLINAMDDYLENNATAINTNIPVAVRTKFTASQKAMAMAYVALKRYG